MSFQVFHKTDFFRIYTAFCEAFSDYKISMQPNREDFLKRLKRMNFHYELSGAIALQEQFIAFVLHGKGIFGHKKSLYNGGTGVLPHFRNQKLIKKIYDNLFPKLTDFEQIVLEVFTDNWHALRLYQDLGFQKMRFLESFSLEKNILLPKKSLKIQLRPTENPDWLSYESFCDSGHAWQNTKQAILFNFPDETFLEAYFQEKLVAFVIFEPKTSKISQIGVHHDFRRHGIGTILLKNVQNLCESPHLKIINIDSENQTLLSFVQKIGFIPFIKQYEMFLPLK